MKLSVLNSTPRQGKTACLIHQKEAKKFSHQKVTAVTCFRLQPLRGKEPMPRDLRVDGQSLKKKPSCKLGIHKRIVTMQSINFFSVTERFALLQKPKIAARGFPTCSIEDADILHLRLCLCLRLRLHLRLHLRLYYRAFPISALHQNSHEEIVRPQPTLPGTRTRTGRRTSCFGAAASKHDAALLPGIRATERPSFQRISKLCTSYQGR